LEGEAADQRSTSEFLFGEDAGECIGSESYIGIEKEESIVGGEVCELPASVLFSVPSGGQSSGSMELDERKSSRVFFDDVCCLVFGSVVKYEDFEGCMARFRQGIERVPDTGFFVSGGDQDAYGDIPSE